MFSILLHISFILNNLNLQILEFSFFRFHLEFSEFRGAVCHMVWYGAQSL